MNHGLRHIITSLLVLPAIACLGQLVSVQIPNEINFTATRNGKNIGSLKTSVSHSGNEYFLLTESNLVIDIVISFSAKAITTNKYTGLVLMEASLKRTVNGRKKLENHVRFENGRYHVTSTGETTPVTRAIRHTVTYLYFNEPAGIKEVFSEVYLSFLTVTKLNDSTYRTLLPDGGSMTYHYQFGKLTQVVAKTTYGTVIFTVVP